MKNTILLLLLLILSVAIYAADPVVTNATASQRTDGSKIVDIYFDVSYATADSVYITLNLSNDGGSTYTIIPNNANLSGASGKIHIGTGKHIIWQAGNETQSFDGSQFAFIVQAWDSIPIPENFIYIAGGTFNNGVSDVTVSSFYLDKYELTQAAYQAVMGNNPASGYGVGSNYPVYYISWFNAIEYCNKRSINEGQTPCYSYLTYGTNPASWPSSWNSDYNNHTNIICNWTANGYRLPTEAEWEFAARGGISTHGFTYSGSNDIIEVAWYSGNSSSTTHTVGTKTANELGLFDMTGNVWEWNWDIPGTYPSGAQNNPHGAVSGSYRVYRGGSWNSGPSNSTVSDRSYIYATSSYTYVGFRVCRISLDFQNAGA